jgi:hypothetical protein
MTSPQTLSSSELFQHLIASVTDHWALLQLPSACFTLLSYRLLTSVIWESFHSVTSSLQMLHGAFGRTWHTSVLIWSHPKCGLLGSTYLKFPFFFVKFYYSVGWAPPLYFYVFLAITSKPSMFLSVNESNNHNCSRKLHIYFWINEIPSLGKPFWQTFFVSWTPKLILSAKPHLGRIFVNILVQQ